MSAPEKRAELRRSHAIEIARKHAKAKPESYYAEPFQPHEWVIEAIASVLDHAWQLGDMLEDKIVAEQAAVIEWTHGGGAEAGMRWISNGLWGPGLLPDEDAPWGKDAQAWFDANKSNAWPACACGRPSNILGGGIAACSQDCYDATKATGATP